MSPTQVTGQHRRSCYTVIEITVLVDAIEVFVVSCDEVVRTEQVESRDLITHAVKCHAKDLSREAPVIGGGWVSLLVRMQGYININIQA